MNVLIMFIMLVLAMVASVFCVAFYGYLQICFWYTKTRRSPLWVATLALILGILLTLGFAIVWLSIAGFYTCNFLVWISAALILAQVIFCEKDWFSMYKRNNIKRSKVIAFLAISVVLFIAIRLIQMGISGL